ncbi:MAG: DUF5908 family protein [Aureispira sp.]
MPVSINKLTVNTKVNKEGGASDAKDGSKEKSGGGSMSKIEREELIQDCLDRVEELLDYKLRP